MVAFCFRKWLFVCWMFLFFLAICLACSNPNTSISTIKHTNCINSERHHYAKHAKLALAFNSGSALFIFILLIKAFLWVRYAYNVLTTKRQLLVAWWLSGRGNKQQRNENKLQFPLAFYCFVTWLECLAKFFYSCDHQMNSQYLIICFTTHWSLFLIFFPLVRTLYYA